MLTVIYNNLMDPITVIDLPPIVETMEQDVWNVPVPMYPEFLHAAEKDPPPITSLVCSFVSLRRERYVRKGHIHYMFFVDDLQEELALELKSSLLHGQQSDAAKELRRAFIGGVLSALKHTGD